MINSTNRIYNSRIEFKKKLDTQVNALLAKKNSNKHRSFRNTHIQVVDCTKCHRKMSKEFADKQIYYGKKDAPICIPCIMGIPRRKIEGDNKKLKKYKKNYNASKYRDL